MTLEKKRIYSVSELTKEVKELLEHDFDDVFISGEISNFRVPASGHFYFTLKDDAAQIKAVMFKQTNVYSRFLPKGGMQILGRGRISVYEPQGTYQVILDYMEPYGIGSLKQAYEDLKNRLREEGLFDAGKKKELPVLIRSVGVVTSRTGAAVRDFIAVATRRFSNIHIIVYPVKVQGEGAAEEIAEGVRYFNKRKSVDAIVVTRGGGSFEDLLCFSSETVARAIYDSHIPVISAVGHEIDTSISDFVADISAPTPSSAAELIIAKKDELSYRIETYCERMMQAVEHYIYDLEARIGRFKKIVSRPERRLDDLSIRTDDLASRLITLAKSEIKNYYTYFKSQKKDLRRTLFSVVLEKREVKLDFLLKRLVRLSKEGIRYKELKTGNLLDRLDALNPFNLLKRGYSVTKLRENNMILKSSNDTKTGDLLDVILGRGSIECEVTKVNDE